MENQEASSVILAKIKRGLYYLTMPFWMMAGVIVIMCWMFYEFILDLITEKFWRQWEIEKEKAESKV